MTPVKANKWMEENMFPFYPLGDIKVDGEMVKKEESQKKQQP
jgi:2-oxoglutarate ferredoxin oxidoreductase subunit beta